MLWELAETLDLKINLQLWDGEEEKDAEYGRQEKRYHVPALGILLWAWLDFPWPKRLKVCADKCAWQNQTLVMGHNQPPKLKLKHTHTHTGHTILKMKNDSLQQHGAEIFVDQIPVNWWWSEWLNARLLLFHTRMCQIIESVPSMK